MKTKSLIDTNPYLKDPAKRQRLVRRSVKTSGGVEGIRIKGTAKAANLKIPRRNSKKLDKQLNQMIPPTK